MIRSNQQMAYKDAMEVSQSFVDHKAYWYEGHFPYWQRFLSAELRQRIRCRLAFGETLYGEASFYETIQAGAAVC